MQVSLGDLLQFEERYGNIDRSALGVGYSPSTVPAQKLGVLEENSNGTKGYGGCDGRDPDGRLYICEDRNETSGECTQKNYGDGAMCARWERGSTLPLPTWSGSNPRGSRRITSASATVGSSTPTPNYSSSTQCRSAPHLHSSRVLFPHCRTVPNAYDGESGHSLLMVKNVVVQMIAVHGYYIASADCKYFTYVYDRTYGASLEAGDVIDLVGQMYVYYGLDELASVSWVRR